MTSPLVAAYVLVDIPFERTAPEHRKFYIHQRLLDSSLSNWDRWSRDWTWTLDELMGLAADTKLVCHSSEKKEVHTLGEDDDDLSGDSDIAAVEEDGEILPVGRTTVSSIASKLVVQRCWLKECIEAGRVLDRDCGWYIDCVEGWQYPEWDKPHPEQGPAAGSGDRRRWTWGVRFDDHGLGYRWSQEPSRALSPPAQHVPAPTWCASSLRAVSDTVLHTRPLSARPTDDQPASPTPLPVKPPAPSPPCSVATAAELQYHSRVNRLMDESKRFRINKSGGLV